MPKSKTTLKLPRDRFRSALPKPCQHAWELHGFPIQVNGKHRQQYRCTKCGVAQTKVVESPRKAA